MRSCVACHARTTEFKNNKFKTRATLILLNFSGFSLCVKTVMCCACGGCGNLGDRDRSLYSDERHLGSVTILMMNLGINLFRPA